MPGFAAFPDREVGDGQRSDRVGPPPAEGGEQGEPGQRGGREGRAEHRLGGVCCDELVVQGCADLPFAPAQQRHDQQRADGKPDPGK